MVATKVVVDDKTRIPLCKPQLQDTALSNDDDFPEFDDFSDEAIEEIEKAMARAETEYLKKKGTRVMFLDIEAMPTGGDFPKPENDEVLQISSVCAWLLPNREAYVESYVFTLDTCLPIENAKVVECRDEHILLKRWQDLVMEFDPDVLSGYYFKTFDLRYLIQRAEKLNLKMFGYFGRPATQKVQVSDNPPYQVFFVSGRKLVDLYYFIKKRHKLPSYKLNAVSLHFLQKEKEDVNYREIPYLQSHSSSTRQKLAKYCLKDSLLVLDLFQKLNCLSSLSSSSGSTQETSTQPS